MENDITFNKIKKNPLSILVVIVIAAILVFGLFLIDNKTNQKDTPIEEGQIMIQKGDEVITINKNGLVEYKTKDKIYYETWDTSKIQSFFSLIEQKARESLDKPQPQNCSYKIYLFLDGKLFSFCTDDEEVAKEVNEITNKYTENDLSSYFDDDNVVDDQDDKFDGLIKFPTAIPTLGFTTPSPTPTPSSSGSETQTNYPPVKAGCDTWSSSIVGGRAVISNTYCTVEPTSTPSL